MLSTVGLTRMHVTLPIDIRDKEEKELVIALATLTFQPPRRGYFHIPKVDKMKEKISKEVFSSELGAQEFLLSVSRDYDLNRITLSILFGLKYKDEEYPISVSWFFDKGEIKKHTVMVAVPDKESGYTIEVTFNSSEFIWYEDIIDGIKNIIKNRKEGDHVDLAKAVVDFSFNLPGVVWYETTIIHARDNFIARSERRV